MGPIIRLSSILYATIFIFGCNNKPKRQSGHVASTIDEGRSNDAQSVPNVRNNKKNQDSSLGSDSGQMSPQGGTETDDNEPSEGMGAEEGQAIEDVAMDSMVPEAMGAYLTDHDFLEGLPTGVDQLAVICSRQGADRVRANFCGQGGAAPLVDFNQIKSLKELQSAVGLEFPNIGNSRDANSGANGNAAFAITGHSSSLVSKFTSAVNPRAIIFTPPGNNSDDMVAMGFVRGEQFAELIARDPESGELKFFLVSFTQACNENKDDSGAKVGCSDTELLTEAIESNWTSITIHEDIDLNNTIADCKRCHEVEVNGQKQKILRMQELEDPWTHFFRDNRDTGNELIDEFNAAHQVNGNYVEQNFAGIPIEIFTFGDPEDLEDLTRQHSLPNAQPNQFLTEDIIDELDAEGTSATWEDTYAGFASGEFIQVPFFRVSVLDPAKKAGLNSMYQNLHANGVDLPKGTKDTAQFFSEEASIGMGLSFSEEDSPELLMIKACSSCHNLDRNQNISRARFTFDPANTEASLLQMGAAELLVAIERLQLPKDHLKLMPPRRSHVFSEAQIAKVVNYLMGLVNSIPN